MVKSILYALHRTLSSLLMQGPERHWERAVFSLTGCTFMGFYLFRIVVLWGLALRFGTGEPTEPRTDLFLLGLGFLALAYLSDLRYRLFFEEKEHRAGESEGAPGAQQASVR